MADVVLEYAPADGATFAPEEFNKDLYETPNNLTAGRASLYETSNGYIEFANLSAAFRVRSHMVRPWQAGFGQSVGAVKPVDFFQDAWGQDAVAYGIAGANLTWYQHYDVNIALFLTSFFANVWRQRGKGTGDQSWGAAPDVRVRMYIDGSPITHTRRMLPETVYYSSTKSFGGGYDYNFAREERNTRYMNLHHTKIVGGSAGNQTNQLLKGWHSVGLFIYVARNLGSEDVNLDGAPASGNVYPRATWNNMHRVRLFVRHADVIPLL